MQQQTHVSNRNAGHRVYKMGNTPMPCQLYELSPQARKMLELLVRDGRVTRLTAMHVGICNPTARVADLRRLGWEVECAIKLDPMGREYGSWTLREGWAAVASDRFDAEGAISTAAA